MTEPEMLPEMLREGEDPIDWTTRQQSLASDPARSAWVSANAGSGKTHVLTQRSFACCWLAPAPPPFSA